MCVSASCLPCLGYIVGRRLKGAGQTRNGEEEQQPTAWGPGEREERKKDVIPEPGNMASTAQGSED